jgi:hypothetical protein
MNKLLLILTAVLIGLPGAATAATTITFSTFPGVDNILGTLDDIVVNAPWPPSAAVHFTNQYAFLSGGVGVVVDSKPNAQPVNSMLGAIVKNGPANNILVQARPDASPTAFSYGALDFRFVSSLDGLTPSLASIVELDFVTGISAGALNTARFYDESGSLLHTATYTDGTGSNHVSYSHPGGIGRVSITTSFSVATDNFTFTPMPVPEPSRALLLALGLGPALLRRQRR